MVVGQRHEGDLVVARLRVQRQRRAVGDGRLPLLVSVLVELRPRQDHVAAIDLRAQLHLRAVVRRQRRQLDRDGRRAAAPGPFFAVAFARPSSLPAAARVAAACSRARPPVTSSPAPRWPPGWPAAIRSGAGTILAALSTAATGCALRPARRWPCAAAGAAAGGALDGALSADTASGWNSGLSSSAPLHLALDADRRAVLEQPGRVDDALAQHAQQQPEVVLAAVAQQHGARVGDRSSRCPRAGAGAGRPSGLRRSSDPSGPGSPCRAAYPRSAGGPASRSRPAFPARSTAAARRFARSSPWAFRRASRGWGSGPSPAPPAG